MTKSPAEHSDIELYAMLRMGKPISEKAFAELYARHSPRIFAYCRRILGDYDKAQDAFQDTFVKFFNSAQQEREMSNVPAYLLRIARNLCLNMQRGQKGHVSLEEYHLPLHSDMSHDKKELLDLITKAMEQLPTDYKEAFVLREYEGLSYQEIAELTESSLSTVKIRIFRAKQKIREILAPYVADLSQH
ncbi:MAG: RNA polymerase sigma factor [Ignavibacteria bacterium]|jgi:RNA polymerase sigma-70 factor (ECF subfamily)